MSNAANEPEGRGLRVVVADNDPDALDLIAMDLHLEGHDVVGQARSGQEAIEMCERLQPDVLVVDHRMPPGLTGVEVARRLQRSPVRVIVYTNYVRPDVAEGAARWGARMIAKGSLPELRRAVRG